MRNLIDHNHMATTILVIDNSNRRHGKPHFRMLISYRILLDKGRIWFIPMMIVLVFSSTTLKLVGLKRSISVIVVASGP